MSVHPPPGWPRDVPPPDADEWRSRAVGWLLDLCPADYRGHPVLARHPVALVRLAAHHVEAGLEAQRRARATARERLGDVLPPGAMEEVLEVLDVEQARLLAARRGVDLVETALRGQRFVPRL